jgi:hypothetical protein
MKNFIYLGLIVFAIYLTASGELADLWNSIMSDVNSAVQQSSSQQNNSLDLKAFGIGGEGAQNDGLDLKAFGIGN